MTYNIRYDNPDDGENRWSARKSYLSTQIKFYEPDVFGIQEGLKHQVDYLDSCLSAYQYVGVGRDDGRSKGEYSALFYDTTRFDLEKSGTFWLSQTPDRPSVGWDAALERICTYILLKDKDTDLSLWVFNTHFDHIGEEARYKSTLLIRKKMVSLNSSELPMILMGDLNLEPEERAIKYLTGEMNDSKEVSKEVVFGPDGTFNGFKFNEAINRRIDYIFTNSKIVVNKYAVLSDSKDRKYPSDHLPVYAEVTLIP